MNLLDFRKALTARLSPLLRREGFKGAATSMRRQRLPIIHAVSIGGSPKHNRVFFEVAAHLSFLSPCGRIDIPLDPNKCGTADCEFDWRLSIAPAGSSGGWGLPEAPQQAEQTIEAIEAAWLSQGHSWLERFSSWPESFLALIEQNLGSDPQFYINHRDARIAAKAGARDLAMRCLAHGQRDSRLDSFWRDEYEEVKKQVIGA